VNDLDLILRLLLATALAGAVGVERELTDQPAGFRTHILVGLGACLFAVLSIAGVAASHEAGPGAGSVDVTRIAAQIVTGIGFIGAGVIFKYGPNIRGLTTAATLWVTAAIGTAAGMGAPVLALATTIVTVLVLVGLRPLRRFVRRYSREDAEFVVEGGSDLRVEPLARELTRLHVGVEQISIGGENGTKSVRLVLRLPPEAEAAQVAETLSKDREVTKVDWSRH
jgi:putative Mg2+ transporter-C (MgtC) family protein